MKKWRKGDFCGPQQKKRKKKKRCFFQYYTLDFSPMLMKMHKCLGKQVFMAHSLLPDILYRVTFREMKRHRKKKKHTVNCYKVKENEICFQLLAFKPVFPSWLNVLLVNRKSHGNNAGLKSQVFRILICRAGRRYQIAIMQILTPNQIPGRPLKAEEKREALNKLGTWHI